EIVSNMHKHRKTECHVRFFCEDNMNPSILFLNDIKDDSRQNIKKIMQDFNSSKTNELMKRNSHGLYFIKTLLEQMNISAQLDFVDDSYVLKLTFNNFEV
ncbi:MAG: hypothetical protein ACKOE6_00840, partial [Flammeovirgaceae bacterium]